MGASFQGVTTKKTLARLLSDAQKNPEDAELKHQLNSMTRRYVPHWHLPMLYDDSRNLFYQRMIEKAVRGKTILEIGAGTGFLSIIAARAGAKHVYACEGNPLFQNIAEQVIEQSSFAHQITLIPKLSTQLRIGKDLPAKVDLIVSEIISTDLFTENIVTYLRDAKRLLKSGGTFLPATIEVWGCLVENEAQQRDPDERTVHTELLEKLVDHVPQMNAAHRPLRLVSKPKKFAVLEKGFELTPTAPWTLKLKRTASGSQTSFCLYFRCIDGKNQLTNFVRTEDDPKTMLYASSWGQMLYPLDERDEYTLKIHLIEDRYPVVMTI